MKTNHLSIANIFIASLILIATSLLQACSSDEPTPDPVPSRTVIVYIGHPPPPPPPPAGGGGGARAQHVGSRARDRSGVKGRAAPRPPPPPRAAPPAATLRLSPVGGAGGGGEGPSLPRTPGGGADYLFRLLPHGLHRGGLELKDAAPLLWPHPPSFRSTVCLTG